MKSHRGRCIRLAGFLLALIGSVVAAQTQSPPHGLALVVGISRFADAAISPLPGIENDVAVARKIASYIGISASGTVVLSDERATANAVRSHAGRQCGLTYQAASIPLESNRGSAGHVGSVAMICRPAAA